MYDNSKINPIKILGPVILLKFLEVQQYEHVGKLLLKWERETNTEKVTKFTWVPLDFRGNINHILCQAFLNSISCTFLNGVKEKTMVLQQVQTEVKSSWKIGFIIQQVQWSSHYQSQMSDALWVLWLASLQILLLRFQGFCNKIMPTPSDNYSPFEKQLWSFYCAKSETKYIT